MKIHFLVLCSTLNGPLGITYMLQLRIADRELDCYFEIGNYSRRNNMIFLHKLEIVLYTGNKC